ncbi:MAG: hypothetical protein ABI321_12790 [Polyangia bacterium]
MRKLWIGLVLVFAACGGSAECVKDSDCGTGSSCVYKVADGCEAQGECVAKPTGIQCYALESYCGCSGTPVNAGCGFPAGYATGPTTGVSSAAGTCAP